MIMKKKGHFIYYEYVRSLYQTNWQNVGPLLCVFSVIRVRKMIWTKKIKCAENEGVWKITKSFS